MLVSFEDNVQHLSSLLAVVVDQLLANNQQAWESRLNDLVEVYSSITALESVHSADSQKALESSKDAAWIGGVEEVQGDIHELWPFRWEVVVEDLLEGWNELRANWCWGRGEHWEETAAEARLLILRYGLDGCLLAWGPSLGDSVLQVDGGYVAVSIPASKYKYDKVRGPFDILASLTPASCSPWRISRSASVKPACSSAYIQNQSRVLHVPLPSRP